MPSTIKRVIRSFGPFAGAVALLAALVCASAAPASAEDEVRAQWWFGARLSLSPGSVSENGGKQLVTVTAEVSEWGTSSSDLSYEVTVGKGGDGAVSGTDYKAVSKFRINIKSGRRSGSNSFTWSRSGTPTDEGDRDGDLWHGLRGRFGLHDHHRGERDERDGHVHLVTRS